MSISLDDIKKYCKEELLMNEDEEGYFNSISQSSKEFLLREMKEFYHEAKILYQLIKDYEKI